MIKTNDYAMTAEVYEWPEFKAFAERLGVKLDIPTTYLAIYLPHDGVVSVEHEHYVITGNREANT